MESRRQRCRGPERGTSLVEVVLALALVGAAVLVAAGGLRNQARLLELAEHRDVAARVLEAAVDSVRSGILPLQSGDFAPPVPTGLKGLRVDIEVRDGDRENLYSVAAVARWREGRRVVEQRLESMVWRP